MSVRDEDRQKNCPNRGLGIAVAAIGVGVGAALYYFFSKRAENPDEEGATTAGWSCESPHALYTRFDDSYATISEHSTSDTSMYETEMDEDELDQGVSDVSALNDELDQGLSDISALNDELDQGVSDESDINDNDTSIMDDSSYTNGMTADTDTDDMASDTSDMTNDINDMTTDSNTEWSSPGHEWSETSITDMEDSDSSDTDSGRLTAFMSNISDDANIRGVLLSRVDISDLDRNQLHVPGIETTEPDGYERSSSRYESSELAQPTSGSDTELEWDVTTSSVGVPTTPVREQRSPLSMLYDAGMNLIRAAEKQRAARLRNQAFRERSWTLEECSICFDVMLVDQEVMALPCTHRFHQQCILPWLQEKQTCPYCRKSAECE